MARPRKVSDEQVLEAAYRLMERRGPAQWTLADVAAEVGVTAGALVQRFGSKRALQVALIAGYADGMPAQYEALRARHASPLAALYAYADRVARLAPTRERLAHHLDYLRLDLTDPDMHAHFSRSAQAARDFLRDVVADAIDAGELTGAASPAVLARLLESVLAGSLFTWATYEEGTAREWVRRDVDLLLSPWIVKGP